MLPKRALSLARPTAGAVLPRHSLYSQRFTAKTARKKRHFPCTTAEHPTVKLEIFGEPVFGGAARLRRLRQAAHILVIDDEDVNRAPDQLDARARRLSIGDGAGRCDRPGAAARRAAAGPGHPRPAHAEARRLQRPRRAAPPDPRGASARARRLRRHRDRRTSSRLADGRARLPGQALRSHRADAARAAISSKRASCIRISASRTGRWWKPSTAARSSSRTRESR